MTNRLANETSPYLLQHKDNPVDWYAWGLEALKRAQQEDKPIFLSIGYAACHWCHVMEHESFEDPETAALMNQHFVSIKVDREERPDLDGIYMSAVVALTGQGGWPMSVFLTPDGTPFYGGTYFPPRPAHGMPAFRQVLEAVADAWRSRREEVMRGGREVLEHVRRASGEMAGQLAPDRELAQDTLQTAAQGLWRQFDWRAGGWGNAPKFPQSMAIEFLMRHHRLTGEATPLEMVTKTLEAMARGGIYDQLGGGFHRYSTDATWVVPHFEKMLYDNAQLARAYVHAWQLTGEPEWRRIAEETLDYVRREMTDTLGGFYSTQDADSEGEEGKFFVWSEGEVDEALGADAKVFKDAYGVTAHGNFEGHNILVLARDAAEVASRNGREAPEVASALRSARQKLFERREGRVRPGRDDKVLAAWNGLMLAAFADAARAFGRDDYQQTAIANARFLLGTLRRVDGRLYRSWRLGEARLNGYLEDYTHVAEGLLALYETTFDPQYYTAARELMDQVLAHFADAEGGFFDTSDEHEQLITRPKDMQDNATPSGNAMAATVLLKLALLTGEGRYSEVANGMLAGVQPAAAKYPAGFGQWLAALAFALGQPREVALIGNPGEAGMQALLGVVFEGYQPYQVVALKRPGEESPVPLLAGREALDGKATAAVCYNFACRLPVTEPAALRQQLEASAGK